MKKIIAVLLIVIFMVMLLPLAIVYLIGRVEKNTDEVKQDGGVEQVSVYIADEDRTTMMNTDEYIKCVVAAEMPVDFEVEALKAQSVAARTYLYAHIEAAKNGNVSENHNGAWICTDSTHCQAYISEQKRREEWGGDADEKWKKISAAVEDTTGQIMTYNGEIISAVFHSTSSGETEAAVDVWGSDVPYLQSVESVGDEMSPKYKSEISLSVDEFKSIIEEKVDGVDWTKGLFANINRSHSGGIISLDVGGVNIKGTEFRSLFSLRSTNAELAETDGMVEMSVKGYGHGVGMSQYGANYLAEQGKTYDEILKTYYTGIKIETRQYAQNNL